MPDELPPRSAGTSTTPGTRAAPARGCARSPVRRLRPGRALPASMADAPASADATLPSNTRRDSRNGVAKAAVTGEVSAWARSAINSAAAEPATFHQIADLGAARWPGRQRPRAVLVPLSWPPPQVRHGQIGHHSAQNRRPELR